MFDLHRACWVILILKQSQCYPQPPSLTVWEWIHVKLGDVNRQTSRTSSLCMCITRVPHPVTPLHASNAARADGAFAAWWRPRSMSSIAYQRGFTKSPAHAWPYAWVELLTSPSSAKIAQCPALPVLRPAHHYANLELPRRRRHHSSLQISKDP